MAEVMELICPTSEAKYFCKWGWTQGSKNCPTGKSLKLFPRDQNGA
jgi:hypothetical protein